MRVELIQAGAKALSAETRAPTMDSSMATQTASGKAIYDQAEAKIKQLKFELAKANQDLQIAQEKDIVVVGKPDISAAIAEEAMRNSAKVEKYMRK